MNKIDELLQNLVMNLPAERNNETFYDFVEKKYNEYLFAINNTPKDDFDMFLDSTKEFVGNATKERFISLVMEIMGSSLYILQQAYKGDTYNAYKRFENLFLYQKYTQNKLVDMYVNYFSTDIEAQDFYRCVDFPIETPYNMINCWHVPFNKRQSAKRNRFNQSGVPCFYVSNSEKNAIEETGKVKESQNRWIGRFRLNKPLRFLDFTIPDIKKMTEYEKFSFLITYPIRLTCLTKVKYDDAEFCEEYIFPQLFFHVLFMHKNDKFQKVEGIRYVSMHDRESTCLVIPALYESKTPQKEGYSSNILSQFTEVEKPRLVQQLK